MTNSISEKQLAIITGTGFTLTKLYIMPAFLSNISESALWVSAFINVIIDYFLLIFILKIIRNLKNQKLFNAIENSSSNKFAKVIFLFYAVFFIFKAFTPIVEQKNSIELTFYETQPTLLTFMPFFVVAFYILLKGFRPFGRSYETCLWIYIFGMGSIVLLSVFAGDYTSLLPIIPENPLKILEGSLRSLIWFGDPIYILFFAGYIEKSSQNLKRVKSAYIISSISTIFILMLFYAVFDSIAPRQYYATLKMSKYSIALSNIGRFDYISAFMLAATSVFQVCLPLLLANMCLNDCFEFKSKFVSPFIIISLEIAFAILTEHTFISSINFMSKYLVYFFIIMTYILPILLYYLFGRKKHEIQTC